MNCAPFIKSKIKDVKLLFTEKYLASINLYIIKYHQIMLGLIFLESFLSIVYKEGDYT